MTTSRHDLRHGRQGGRIVDWNAGPGKTIRARECDRCHGPMLVGQQKRHHVCDGTTLIGERCICPPGCTDTRVGDRGTCAAACEPCRIAKGLRHDAQSLWTPKKS